MYSKKELKKMLLDLITIQDSVTHANENGLNRDLAVLLDRRNELMQEILNYVQRWVDEARDE